jgi:predicted AlkP superfamily phosphohydrolase/phosphomutase
MSSGGVVSFPGGEGSRAPFRGRRPVLVLGLDAACLEVVEPLCAAGRLPHLDAWRRQGHWAPLRSSVPPVSFPAWSTFLTGLGPGQHGIFDFTQKVAGAYRVGFVNASHRVGASIFERVSRAGGRVLALGIPATYPPEPVRGLLVSGFDAPVSVGTAPRSASDPNLYRRIAAHVGPFMSPDLDESGSDAGFHERAVDCLLASIERKKRFALEALAEARRAGSGRPPDLTAIVFSESDTVSHHYWRDHDPASPRHDPSATAQRKRALTRVYQALDSACGEIRAAFGDEVSCVVMSDHGSGGAGARVVHLGRRLAESGLLRRARGGDGLARGLRDLALGVLTPRAAEQIFRRARGAAARLESVARFGGIDWRRSPAFSEEANTQPGVWINLRGRESRGCVSASDYERVRDEVIGCLLDWKLPGGSPVVARARRREEVYAGSWIERAPDVVVELALDDGYGLSLVPTPWAEENDESIRTLSGAALAGGRGRGMNGTHRPDGMWLSDDPDLALRDASLEDAAPRLLRALGLDPGSDLFPPGPVHEYDAVEQERVASRLRALGYLA